MTTSCEIWVVPQEPTPNRYPSQWYRRFVTTLEQQMYANFKVIKGNEQTDFSIKRGEVYDAFSTMEWRGGQLAHIATSLQKGQHPCIILFLDGWNPIIEGVAYMRDLAGLDFKMAALLHGGTWDPFDYINHVPGTEWAILAERSWLSVLDRIYVASKYHESLIRSDLGFHCETFNASKIKVLPGFPIWTDEILTPMRCGISKNKQIMYPHDLHPRKGFDTFRAIRKELEEYVWVVPHEMTQGGLSPNDYYDSLARSQVVLSTAESENFGIAMAEGRALGCYPIVPDGACYPEFYPAKFRYSSTEEAVSLVRKFMEAKPLMFERPVSVPKSMVALAADLGAYKRWET